MEQKYMLVCFEYGEDVGSYVLAKSTDKNELIAIRNKEIEKRIANEMLLDVDADLTSDFYVDLFVGFQENYVNHTSLQIVKYDDSYLKGCMHCLGRVDDGFHEYDEEYDIWYCPVYESE